MLGETVACAAVSLHLRGGGLFHAYEVILGECSIIHSLPTLFFFFFFFSFFFKVEISSRSLIPLFYTWISPLFYARISPHLYV